MSLPVQEISSRLFALEKRPQFEIPPFPWEDLEEIFKKRFPGKKIRLTHQNRGWSEGEPWLSAIKEQEVFPIFMPPVEKPLFFTMIKEDLDQALSNICDREETSFYFLEKPVYEAFTQFFACEILKLISQLKFAEYLSFHVSNQKNLIQTLTKEAFFVIDVMLEIEEQSMRGSVVVPASFRTSWKKSFLQTYGPIFSPELQKRVDLDLGIQVGYVDLAFEEFKGIEKGDWIFLDNCTYKPDVKEGFGQLTIGGEAIFGLKFQKGKLEVLEYSHLHEGEIEMSSEDDLEKFEDDDEESFTEEEHLEEEVSLQESTESTETSLLSKIPMHVIVEVAKLRMSLEDLGKLQAGAVLDLPVAYEEGVNLVVNGKKIGKGELVKIGDKMGVRITHL